MQFDNKVFEDGTVETASHRTAVVRDTGSRWDEEEKEIILERVFMERAVVLNKRVTSSAATPLDKFEYSNKEKSSHLVSAQQTEADFKDYERESSCNLNESMSSF